MSNLLSPEAKEFIPRQHPLVNDVGGVASDAPPTNASDPVIGQKLNGLPKEFIPHQPPLVNDVRGVANETPPIDGTEPAIGQQINGLPVYMTTCFPFVQGTDVR